MQDVDITVISMLASRNMYIVQRTMFSWIASIHVLEHEENGSCSLFIILVRSWSPRRRWRLLHHCW